MTKITTSGQLRALPEYTPLQDQAGREWVKAGGRLYQLGPGPSIDIPNSDTLIGDQYAPLTVITDAPRPQSARLRVELAELPSLVGALVADRTGHVCTVHPDGLITWDGLRVPYATSVIEGLAPFYLITQPGEQSKGETTE
jgi:hypothetical protein